jgi:hypothetical protein
MDSCLARNAIGDRSQANKIKMTRESWSLCMSHKQDNKPDNVIPIRKADRFFLAKGFVTDAGEVVERERVGVAFLKPGSSLFRLKLWMFPEGEFFLARRDGDHSHYVALSREEFVLKGELKSHWHKVGVGETVGNFIRINFHLLPDDIYLCLFPTKKSEEEAIDVA